MEVFCLPLTDLQRAFYKQVSPLFLVKLHPHFFLAAEVTVFLWRKLQVVTELLGKQEKLHYLKRQMFRKLLWKRESENKFREKTLPQRQSRSALITGGQAALLAPTPPSPVLHAEDGWQTTAISKNLPPTLGKCSDHTSVITSKTNRDCLPLVGFRENQVRYNCQFLQRFGHLLNSQDLEQCLAYKVCSRNGCRKNGYLQQISKPSIFSHSFGINYITSVSQLIHPPPCVQLKILH